jgi:CarD family transcriptional regulator
MQASADVEFKVGDKAVYPAQGVAEVISIDEKDIAGSRQRFYVLRILDTDRKIMVPVSNANAVGLRQVISEQEIREIFDILRERTIGFDTQTWNRRYRGFMDKIKTGSIYDVAEVLRDLYRLKANKQLSFGERRMLDTARSLIVKEIAIAREQTEEQVKDEIDAIFFSNRARGLARSTALRVAAVPEEPLHAMRAGVFFTDSSVSHDQPRGGRAQGVIGAAQSSVGVETRRPHASARLR